MIIGKVQNNHFFLMLSCLIIGLCAPCHVIAAENLYPGKYPLQEQAIHNATGFLQAMDNGNRDDAIVFLSPEVHSQLGDNGILSNFTKIQSSLGGSADRRDVVGMDAAPPEGNYNSSSYLVIFYRSIYPRGRVLESVTMSLEHSEWKVVGWRVEPSK
ncbi:hypothetical protein D3C75_803290 [compost metagenome]